MKKKIISTLLCTAMLMTSVTGLSSGVSAAAKTPQYQTTARQMEELDRGLIATYRTKDDRSVMSSEQGVYLSWRLMGTESLENQAFDIYRNGTKIHTTGVHDATNYVDTAGTTSSKYKVVKAGATEAEVALEKEVTPGTNNTAKGSEVGNGNSEKNSFTYVDIPIVMPADVARMGDGKTSTYVRTRYDGANIGGANDASVGDLDGDGDYEVILKWDPQDSKDSAGADFTGNVYIDAYQIDPNNEGYMWRIDLGQNVTAGAHYTQFIVYDFNGDGKSEIAMKTAPGSIDGQGNYVSLVGDTEAIRNVDNTASFIGTSGRLKGKNPFTQYLTIFDGETGAALYTTDYIPYEMYGSKYWGDGSAKYNRSERYLAGVAYLDGVHPSLIMCRGYYDHAVVRAYNWDGSELSLLWEHSAGSKSDTSLFGQGNHNLSIADIDNDGKDEIVYGSAALDDNGIAMGNTYLGHGDAMHVNDFNNDGVQEVYSVKEDSVGYKNNAADFRVAGTGANIWGKGASGDTGRGVMANIDDEYAKANDDGLSLAWSSSHTNLFDLAGNEITAKPSAGSRSMDNFLVFWDGDLGRELLDDNIIGKYRVSTAGMKRFYGPSDGYSLSGSSNNHSKRTPSLVADIWGDWREEIIMPVNDGDATAPALRIFTSTLPTNYRLATLMHDSQYRCAVAWQNVAYNQPTHTSYYVGSAALATDENGNELNYLAPAVPYTKVVYSLGNIPVTGVTLSESKITVERGKTSTIKAIIEPTDASKKGIIWTSSDEKVATVASGVVKGISDGKATITATTKDGGFTASCEVEVYTNYVTGIKLSASEIHIGTAEEYEIRATVSPDNASDSSYTWKSSDESIATVKDGIITGVKEGKATVTATTTDGGFVASCEVNVYPMITTDVTGEDVFVTTNTDAETVLASSTATSASLRQTAANVGGEFHKDFESFTEDEAVISFKFTTGGQRIDGSNWNWEGHEYTFGLKFLDTNGNNIFTISQAYKSKAQATMGQIGTNEAEDMSAWDRTITDGEGPFARSTTRWFVTLRFNYEKDTCTATLSGATSDWVKGVTCEKTFPLNGASFKTLQYYTTKDGAGYISVSPDLAELTYETVKSSVPEQTPTPVPTEEPTPIPTVEPTAEPTQAPANGIEIKSAEKNTAEVAVTTDKAYENICLIAVLFDESGKLKEVKLDNFATEEAVTVDKTITFENAIEGNTLKVFAWETLANMIPVCEAK